MREDRDRKLLKVKVTAGAKKESFAECAPDAFEISVREPARHAAANRRVLALLHRYFGGRVGISIVKGHRSSAKIVSVMMRR